jgi:carbamoylphosphate synthase small subunit
MTTVSVTAEVDLDDVDDRDLVKEIRNRGMRAIDLRDLEQLYYALANNDTDSAITIAGQIVQAATGRIL